MLSNDAYTFIGREFFARRTELADLDAFVDATEIGARKPAPRPTSPPPTPSAVVPEGIVFLDDTPECVEGARRAGMHGILVDPFDRTPAFDRARALLRATPKGREKKKRKATGGAQPSGSIARSASLRPIRGVNLKPWLLQGEPTTIDPRRSTTKSWVGVVV